MTQPIRVGILGAGRHRVLEIEDHGEPLIIGLQFEWLSDAKLVMTDALVEASLKARGPIEGEDGQADE